MRRHLRTGRIGTDTCIASAKGAFYTSLGRKA